MRKKILSAVLSAAIAAASVPAAVITAEPAYTADTAVNLNVTDSGGQSLLDDTYQYFADGDAYYAYMWAPENAEHLNGVMTAKSNLIEARLMQSKTVRDTLAKYNIGIVYLHARNTTENPSANTVMGDFDYRDGANAGATLDEALAKLAAVSGFDELRYAPVIGVGHSAAMGLGHSAASWDPSRTIAQVCLKGGAGLNNKGVNGADYVNDALETQPGVPIFLETGQFTEHAKYDNPAGKDDYIESSIRDVTKIREKGVDRLVTMSVEWESGHYDWSEDANRLLAKYLDAVIPARLGEQALSQDKLSENYALIDLTGTGYLAEKEMYGSRTTEYDESMYKRGDVSEFTEEEQKSMVWFPNEELYREIRGFTNSRKDAALLTPEPSEPENNTQNVFAAVEQQFNSQTGAKLTGNYVRYDKSVMFAFDLTGIDADKPIGKIELSFVSYWGNTWREFKVSRYNEAQDGEIIAVPSEENSVFLGNAANSSVTGGRNTRLDVTDCVENARAAGAERVYFSIEITDEERANYDAAVANGDFTQGTYNSPYNGADLVFSTTSTDRIETNDDTMPKLEVVYGERIPEEDPDASLETKHQYILLEDPTSRTPRTFTNMTRYDTINPNDALYAEGLDNDPTSFSMYVDKLNVVSPDHIGAGERVAKVSDSPAVITPVMAPVEWVRAERVELSDTDAENNVASKWRNVLRWKNNRLYYRNPVQDSYLNINAFDVYDGNGALEFAYSTNAFMVTPPYVWGGQEQRLTVPEIADVDKDFTDFTFKPESSAGLTVDVIVDYGPIKLEMNPDGSYTVTPEQIPAGARYPIECKIAATQFGVNNNGTKINTAEPVERVFYITDNSAVSALPLNGEINQTALIRDGVTGFNVEGSGTITLKMNSDTRFNAERAAAISAERAGSADEYYKKHYQYPAGYAPYAYWGDYPGEWTAEVESGGFVPLSAFKNGDKTNINLRYLNETASSGITSITPVCAQTEISNPRVNSWGGGVNIVWQSSARTAYDSVKVYIKNGGAFEEAPNVTAGRTNALVSGLEDGDYTFKITTLKDGNESEGVIVSGTADKYTYSLEDFEAGDLTSGMNLLGAQELPPVYSWTTPTGAAVVLSKDADGNSYLGMQNNYTSAVQTVNINIPDGLKPDMTELRLDILADKLENSQSAGQVYFELFSPETGKSYGVEKGDDFALEDKEWHRNYTVKLSGFNLPEDGEALSKITVLKIGRKPVSGGNNNRRAKLYLDNITLAAEEPVREKKLALSAENAYENNASLPNGTAFNGEQIGYLFDGDTSNAKLYKAANQKYVYFDLGAEYRITKVAVTEYTTKGTLVISASNTDPTTISSRDEAFKQILRTNGSTSSGVPSSYEPVTDADGAEIGRTASARDIYTVSGFETVRYICMGDWSNGQSVAELEIYVVDDSEPEPSEPPATQEPSEPPATREPSEPPATREPSEPPEPPATLEPSEPPATSEPEFAAEFKAPRRTDAGIALPVEVTGTGSLDALIYAAEYDSDGRLTAVRAAQRRTVTETGELLIPCGTDGAVRVYVWDERQAPLAPVYGL